MNDIKITVIDRQGESHQVEAPTDMSMNIMELIKACELAPEASFGICGGMLMCASCQCYMLSEDIPLPPMSEDEEAVLYSEGNDIRDNSRLSCQIPITEELEGLVLQIAPFS